MPPDYTDLLPPERHKTLEREYYLRLGIAGASLAILLIIVAAVLLVPAFVYLRSEVKVRETRLSGIESSLTATSSAELALRLKTLSSDAGALSALGTGPTATNVVRAALAVPHAGISIVGFDYTPAVGTTPGKLAITGTASTRDALRTYQLALEAASFAASADLPVSAYAKDTDIPFTISVTLSP